MTRDRTGDLLEQHDADEAKARIRALLCPGEAVCGWDHEHAVVADDGDDDE